MNTAGEYQTTQILKDGETLEMVVNPPNLVVDDGEGSLSEKFFFGWYVVNETDDTTDLDQASGKYSGTISYTWPAEDLEKIRQVIRDCVPEMAGAELNEDTVINTETAIDSMGFILVICKLEALFDVRIPERQWQKLSTMGDVADAIMKRLPKK